MKNDTLIVNESGIRLDKYIAEKVGDISRSQIQKYIKSGNVLVNGIVEFSKYSVNEGDEIHLLFDNEIYSESVIKPQNIPLDIIYEDEFLIVVNKPPGLTVHPGVGNREGTMANALAYHFNNLSDVNGPLRPGIVHRLDQDTSGVIVVAKNNSVHMKLAEQFSSRKVKKIYFGITWGKWKMEEGIINGSLARKRSDPTAFEVNTNGKEAQTKYIVVKETEYFSYINYFPKSGRTHQIRVHSAFAGHPIIGDEKYGGGKAKIKGYLPEVTKKLDDLFCLIHRHILHAQKISFFHPISGAEVSFESELPEDIQKILLEIESLNV